ncbi:hypothetical protein ACLB2K_062112 [Fragaria x ananassa]
MLSSDGNLVVFDETRDVIWSTNASVSASAMSKTTALLLDTGNLVLRFGNQTLWESFNYPTDTVVPGMKIGFNKRTGQQWLLTSWAASDDPQPGKFTSGIDPKVPSQLLTWKENVPYWRSAIYIDSGDTTLYRGPGGEFFCIDDRSFFYLAYTNRDEEAFFTFGVSDKSVKLITVLKASEKLLLQLWEEDKETWIPAWGEPLHTCDYIARCGPNGACDKYESVSPCKCLTGFTPKIQEQWDVGNWEGGCIREKNLACDDHEEGLTKFEKLKLPDHSIMLYKGSIKNHTHGQDLYIRVRQQHSYQVDDFFKGPLGIALVSSAAGLLALLFGCFLWKKTLGSFGGSKNKTIGDLSTGGEKSDTELPFFDLRCVLAATNNFSEANKLGEGGFGPVYKGIFPENQVVAIKRLSKKSGQGHQEFLNEIKLIAKLQHNNLVRLLGCCVEEEEMILIYEFMPNRSLDKFLFDPSEKTKLDWAKRFRIIEGIAQGVLYIHKYSRLKIIHRDLKASNVLLDEEMNPKVSDFGLARIFGVNQTEANTNRVVGTYGYMSPEYARYGHFSEKSDVFSFRVLLLEIVSGRKNSSIPYSEDSPTLAQWVTENYCLEIMERRQRNGSGDASVRETSQSQEALRCIEVSFLCVQEAPADRPTMATVILMLQSNEANTLPPSKEPAFSTHSKDISGSPSSQISTNLSSNALTVSIPEGR